MPSWKKLPVWLKINLQRDRQNLWVSKILETIVRAHLRYLFIHMTGARHRNCLVFLGFRPRHWSNHISSLLRIPRHPYNPLQRYNTTKSFFQGRPNFQTGKSLARFLETTSNFAQQRFELPTKKSVIHQSLFWNLRSNKLVSPHRNFVWQTILFLHSGSFQVIELSRVSCSAFQRAAVLTAETQVWELKTETVPIFHFWGELMVASTVRVALTQANHQSHSNTNALRGVTHT